MQAIVTVGYREFLFDDHTDAINVIDLMEKSVRGKKNYKSDYNGSVFIKEESDELSCQLLNTKVVSEDEYSQIKAEEEAKENKQVAD